MRSPGPELLRRALVSATALVALCAAQDARAQTVTVPGRLTRTQTLRSGDLQYWINYDDCLKDDVLSFDVTFGGTFQNQNLEVWAGPSSCELPENRKADSTTCWLVYRKAQPVTPATVSIRARDIVGHLTPGKTPNGPDAATDAVCSAFTREALVLTFLFASDSSVILGTHATWTKTGYDVGGPAAPAGLEAGQGEERLHLSWTAGDSELVEYRFFCDPPPGPAATNAGAVSTLGTVRQFLDAGADAAADGAVIDAAMGGAPGVASDAATDGAPGAAGTGGASSVAATCQATVLKPGERPIPDSDVASLYQCGKVTGASATSGVTSALRNGVSYAVAVAGVDDVGNVGPLSNVDCATPENVTDFFEYYRRLGGKGGGGFCAMSARREAPGWPGLVAGLALSTAALFRRRRFS